MIAFVFDVESIGLHGEPYAVGWTVVENQKEIDSECLSVNPNIVSGTDDDRAWCDENIPSISVTHVTLESLLKDFWTAWLFWKGKGAIMFAECAWPVEAKFLSMCVHIDYPEQKWSGPYPLHDIASVMLAKGMDPMATYNRTSEELPKHHPLADARQSARLLHEALAK